MENKKDLFERSGITPVLELKHAGKVTMVKLYGVELSSAVNNVSFSHYPGSSVTLDLSLNLETLQKILSHEQTLAALLKFNEENGLASLSEASE